MHFEMPKPFDDESFALLVEEESGNNLNQENSNVIETNSILHITMKSD